MMMNRLTQTQGKRLCELVHLLRTDWDTPGIEVAVREAAKEADALDVARAALNLAANPAVRTPGLLPKPGRHWPTDDNGVTVRTLTPPRVLACPDHGHPEPCPSCATRPMTAADRTALRAALTRQPETDPQEMTA